MTTPAITTRIRRLDELRAKLAAEIVRVPYALPELTEAERAAYLTALHDAVGAFDRAAAVLTMAGKKAEGNFRLP